MKILTIILISIIMSPLTMADNTFRFEIPQPSKIKEYSEDGGSIEGPGLGGGSETEADPSSGVTKFVFDNVDELFITSGLIAPGETGYIDVTGHSLSAFLKSYDDTEYYITSHFSEPEGSGYNDRYYYVNDDSRLYNLYVDKIDEVLFTCLTGLKITRILYNGNLIFDESSSSISCNNENGLVPNFSIADLHQNDVFIIYWEEL